MNKKDLDRVVKDLEFLNNELKKVNNDQNYKPRYPSHIEEDDEPGDYAFPSSRFEVVE